MSIELVEYGDYKEFLPISTIEIEGNSLIWKEKLELKSKPFDLSISNNKKVVRAIGVTGFINIDNVDIEIKPKFLANTTTDNWRKLLWNILLVTENYTNNIFADAGVDDDLENESFLDIMGWVFLNSIRESISEGLPRGYIEKEEYLYEIKGKIDYSKIYSIIETPFLFPCIYDEYDENIPINSLFKWAGMKLSKEVKSFSLSNMLIESVHHIHASNNIPGIIEAENITLPGQYQYAEKALIIAKMLLKQEHLQYKSSPMRSFGFLWNSHSVYEEFIHKILLLVSSLYSSSITIEPQGKTKVASPSLNTFQNIFEYPDFKIKENNQTLFILDAKYKINKVKKDLKHGLPKTEDINQIMVACQIEKCKYGILVFPSCNNHGTYHQTWKVNCDDYPKYISSLYLNLEKMNNIDGQYQLAKELFDILEQIKST